MLATRSEVRRAFAAGQVLVARWVAVPVAAPARGGVFEHQDTRTECVSPRDPQPRHGNQRSLFWRKYVGLDGTVTGIDRLKEPAPAGRLFDFFGFTVTHTDKTVKSLL